MNVDDPPQRVASRDPGAVEHAARIDVRGRLEARVLEAIGEAAAALGIRLPTYSLYAG